jgi:hypothetical protein
VVRWAFVDSNEVLIYQVGPLKIPSTNITQIVDKLSTDNLIQNSVKNQAEAIQGLLPNTKEQEVSLQVMRQLDGQQIKLGFLCFLSEMRVIRRPEKSYR